MLSAGVLRFGAGRVQTSPGPPAYFAPGAVPLTAERFLSVRVGGNPSGWVSGLPADELGRICIAPNNTNPIAGFNAGIAITATGRVAIDTDGPIHHYVAGIPVNAEGRVCINVVVTPGAFSDGFDEGFA